jgi:hypothetical protein
MNENLSLFIGTFTTLLAVVNPLEAMPIFLKLMQGRDAQVHRQVARLSCLYAVILMFFFLIFGTLVMHLFGVPLSMVPIFGGLFSCALVCLSRGSRIIDGLCGKIENFKFSHRIPVNLWADRKKSGTDQQRHGQRGCYAW